MSPERCNFKICFNWTYGTWNYSSCVAYCTIYKNALIYYFDHFVLSNFEIFQTVQYGQLICDQLSKNPPFSHIPQSLLIFTLLSRVKKGVDYWIFSLLWWITLELQCWTVGTANISICTVTIWWTIWWTNYRRLNNQLYLRTETSYKDEIRLISLTIVFQIDQGIVLSQYSSV